MSASGARALKDAVRAAVAAMPGTSEGRSRFSDALAFWVSGHEFAHFHGSTRLDIRLPRERQKLLHGDPRATFREGRSEWMEWHIRTEEDLAATIELLRTAHTAALQGPRRKRSRARRSRY